MKSMQMQCMSHELCLVKMKLIHLLQLNSAFYNLDLLQFGYRHR